MNRASDELIPARMVNEFVYCPRLFHLEWVQGEFEHSEDTLQGAAVHSRVDRESGTLPDPEDIAGEERFVARGVMLSAPKAGLIARVDLLEGRDGAVCPVDYKKGSPGRDGPWDPDRVQLCVQALVLRENGYRCDEGYLYYAATKQRFLVPFDENLVTLTLQAVKGLRDVAVDPVPPPPLVDSPKCPRCSLVGICLPDEVNLLRGAQPQEIRRLVPARNEAAPLYIQHQGATIGKSGERLVVRRRDEEDVHARLIDVSQVSVFGNVQITAPALRAIVGKGAPILHHTYGGWLVAQTTGPDHRNIQLRVAQYRSATDETRSLELARRFVSGKIRNQRTILRRNHPDLAPRVVTELARFSNSALRARRIDRLLGIEGTASRIYFSLFAGMLKTPLAFDFVARTRRPPTDPVNALLSFLYSMLAKDCAHACVAVGLDPYLGFFHQLRYGRVSLALDLAEEFRPIVSDSVVLTLLNNEMIRSADFIRRGPACALKDGARRRVIEAYEARMDTLIRHPLFGYSISYRRILEVQARLLTRVVSGELEEYRPFTTR